MSNPIFGEMLILFLLIAGSARIFFVKYGKVDTLAILAPLAAVLAVLQTAAWGADTFSALIGALAVFAALINFRASLRFAAGLYVDRYSAAFKAGSLFLIILSMLILAALFYFKPVNLNEKHAGVTKQKIAVSGNFTSGFERYNYLSFPAGAIFMYSPAEKSETALDSQHEKANAAHADGNRDEVRTILFVCDKRADSFHYEPLFYALAERGWTVYTGDFFTRDVQWYKGAANTKALRRLAMILDYILHTERFKAQQDFFSFNSAKEFEVLLNFAKENEAERFSPVFIAGDWMAERAISDFCRLHSDDVRGGISLTACSDCKTPGFGCIPITNPLLAFYFHLERANDTSSAKKCAHSLIQCMEEKQGEAL